LLHKQKDVVSDKALAIDDLLLRQTIPQLAGFFFYLALLSDIQVLDPKPGDLPPIFWACSNFLPTTCDDWVCSFKFNASKPPFYYYIRRSAYTPAYPISFILL
jgi:hypothetical protein